MVFSCLSAALGLAVISWYVLYCSINLYSDFLVLTVIVLVLMMLVFVRYRYGAGEIGKHEPGNGPKEAGAAGGIEDESETKDGGGNVAGK